MDVRGYAPAGFAGRSTPTISSHDLMRSSFQLPGNSYPASAGYPAANLAVYVPFWLEAPVTVYETWVETGTLTTSNATEIGVYTTAGTRLFTTATTVATASDCVNSSGMTDYVLDCGSYYLAFGCDGTRNFIAGSMALGLYQSIGCMEQTGLTGAALPATATFAVYTRAYLPLFGLNLRATAL
jgi:hypothetical protein